MCKLLQSHIAVNLLFAYNIFEVIKMIDITTELVKKLIIAQFPQWQHLEIKPVAKSGLDNRTFHLGDKMLIRLPSGPDYAIQAKKEATYLPFLAKNLSLPITCPVGLGQPTDDFPFCWSINTYLNGETLTKDNIVDLKTFAKELASFLKELQSLDSTNGPLYGTHNFHRGDHPSFYTQEVENVLNNPPYDLPTDKIRTIWQESIATKWQASPVWLHGDVAPGNLLIENGHLYAVIDFGIMGIGDPACDYAMAWTFFDQKSRNVFLSDLDQGTMQRAKAWALWKALITLDDANPEVSQNAKDTLQAIIS